MTNPSRTRDTSRPRLSWAVYAAVTLAISVSAYNFGRNSNSGVNDRGSGAGRVSIGIDEERLARLEREVMRIRHLESQVRRLEAGQSASAGAVKLAGNEPIEPQPIEQPLTAEQRAEEARAEQAAFHTDLDARLAAETVDPRWRSQTEAAIADVLPRELGPDVELAEVECASSMCKVVVNHAGSPRIDGRKFTSLFLNRGELGGFALQADNSQEGSTTLYFLYGQELAQADEVE